MMTYKKLVQKAYYKDLGEDVMWKMTDATSKFIESMRVLHPAEVDKFIKDLESELCYPPFTEEQAKKVVANMTNKDGSKGEHWSMAQVKDYMQTHSEYSGLPLYDFYVAINMMYSDYYKASRTTENYAELAKDFLDDKDAPKDKLQRYFASMHDEDLQK